MVRFKYRHLLVEFLQPASLGPSFTPNQPSFQHLPTTENEGDEEDDDQEEVLYRQPDIPFLLPLPDPSGQVSLAKLSDDGGGAIYKAVRGIVQDVYGDEGWGRIASSFKVVYHSPLTTLTIIRVARPHYRLLWSSLTLLTSINGQSVLPRVVAVSGTIKKLQNAAIVYHRNITAQVLAVSLDSQGEPPSPFFPCEAHEVSWHQREGGEETSAGERVGEGARAAERVGGLSDYVGLKKEGKANSGVTASRTSPPDNTASPSLLPAPSRNRHIELASSHRRRVRPGRRRPQGQSGLVVVEELEHTVRSVQNVKDGTFEGREEVLTCEVDVMMSVKQAWGGDDCVDDGLWVIPMAAGFVFGVYSVQMDRFGHNFVGFVES